MALPWNISLVDAQIRIIIEITIKLIVAHLSEMSRKFTLSDKKRENFTERAIFALGFIWVFCVGILLKGWLRATKLPRE